MEYVSLFFQILFYTLGVPVICGFTVFLCEWLLLRMVGRGFGHTVVMATSAIGTPVHELSHALMCIIFGHRIDEMALWRPLHNDGTLGYVSHSYNKRNIYHQIGNIFIGIGPVFGGLGVILLCMVLAFPETFHAYTQNISSMTVEGGSFFSMLTGGLGMITGIFGEWSNGDISVGWRIFAVAVMLCVSLHITLSGADIKGALGGLPVYLGLTLIATVIISLLGTEAMTGTISVLRMFSAISFALFVPVFVCAAIWLALGILIYLLRKLLHLR
ncbi:MAG: hypothetical protein E7645_09285 [Ruminococcaceae bacterium]|nr:hypothetical protein [Oscillospiraceae bacterium]